MITDPEQKNKRQEIGLVYCQVNSLLYKVNRQIKAQSQFIGFIKNVPFTEF